LFDEGKLSGASGQSGPSCSVFGFDFLRDKVDYYGTLIGVSFQEDENGHHTFNYDMKTLEKNARTLINALFKDMGLERMYETNKSPKRSAPLGAPSQTV
jgi:hypothetical protein